MHYNELPFCVTHIYIYLYHGNPQPSFLGVISYNPNFGGSKPSFFMVLGSKGIYYIYIYVFFFLCDICVCYIHLYPVCLFM